MIVGPLLEQSVATHFPPPGGTIRATWKLKGAVFTRTILALVLGLGRHRHAWFDFLNIYIHYSFHIGQKNHLPSSNQEQ